MSKLLNMKVPSPGESISEVELIEWLVSSGDYVEKDQSIAEVDSDKATLELPAEESGVINILVDEGEIVNVGQVVCTIDTSVKKKEKKNVSIAEKNNDNRLVDEKINNELGKKSHATSYFQIANKNNSFSNVFNSAVSKNISDNNYFFNSLIFLSNTISNSSKTKWIYNLSLIHI